MVVCEVRVNGGSPTVAGAEDPSVLAATVTYVSARQELELRVGGMTGSADAERQHMDWIVRDLVIGDEITLKVSSGDPHAPAHRQLANPEADEKPPS
jgi:hypothetical protein